MLQPQRSHHKTGATLYSPFVDDAKVFVLITGYVFAYTYESTGKKRIHLIYGPGAYFPVITTFRDRPQRATYEALTPVVTDVYLQKDFISNIQTDHQFCRNILDKTVDQLAIFADRVIDLQLTKLEDRLLLRLRVAARARGVHEGRFARLPYKLKHHHIADMLGVERESVTRVLHVLRRRGELSVDDAGHFLIPLESLESGD